MTVDLIYICRGRDGGITALQAFLDSLADHPAGAEFRLVCAFKGWEDNQGEDAARRLAVDAGAHVLELPDDGFDWAAYIRTAQQLDSAWVCLLNTHSRIVAPNWLARLLAAADAPGVGAAGCTGSSGTLGIVPQFILPNARTMAETRGWLRGLISAVGGHVLLPYRMLTADRRFPRFPNPHLRSNAVLIRRPLFLEFAATHALPASKSDAHAMESGKAGLTRFVEARGLTAVVCGRKGGPWPVAEAMAAETFRVGTQPNLLVSDNQTRAYDAASRHARRVMELSAWSCYHTR